ncbi:MAG: glycosyltransferase [Bacteroidales bacterium]|nr:glycosyltransferase [Bacteroidales bacterium]
MSINFFYNRLSFYVLAVFVLSLVIQLCIHWIRFSKLAFTKSSPRTKPDDALEPVSVVVCARDSYEHLKELIPALLNQDYPDFEIVVVNDCSDDETGTYLEDLERHEPRIKPVQLRQHLNFFNGKKFPLSMGIKSASHDLLVLTDANCRPTSTKWLRSVVGCYGNNTEIVVGYAPYVKTGGLLNLLVRFDAVQQALLYLSAALAGKPYAGIGKNLSYRQRLFFRQKGFTSHYTMDAGDDDLFVNQAATKKNIGVHIDADNTVVCAAPASFKLWAFEQRRRNTTISKYNNGAKVLLSLHYWSQFLFYGCFIALMALPQAFSLPTEAPVAAYYYPILGGLFLLRYLTQLFIYRGTSRRLGEKGLLPGLILWDFVFALLTPVLRISGRLKASN